MRRQGIHRRECRRPTASVSVMLLVMALVTTACAGIPRSGAVQEGRVSPGDSEVEVEVEYKPASPQRDATPEQILRGFIEAASSPANNYAIAREFLAPELAEDWNPDAGVTVDQQSRREYIETSPTTMSLRVIPVAEVDGNGLYSEFSSENPITQAYGFSEVGGQWRLSAAPNGVILDPIKFVDVFSPYSLSFFDPTFSYLVPDLRWFPSRASTGTRIVRALIDGPSEWLAVAVSTAFPEGTALTKSAVPVEGGVAAVDLNSEALQADQRTLELMQAQLVSSLVGVTTINAVSISIDGNVEQIDTVTLDSPRVDPRPLVSSDNGFGFLGGGAIEQIPGISGSVEELAPIAATLGADHTLAAVQSREGGVYSVRPGSDSVPVDQRPGLIAPALDDRGYIWSVPETAPSDLRAFGPDGETFPVTTSWPDASTITSLALSRDGTRIIALLTVGEQNRFLVAGVERTPDGAPIRLGEPIELTVGDGQPLSATWVDDLTVASLTQTDDGSTEITKQPIGGQSEPVAPLEGAVMLVGGNSAQQLRALTADGDLALRRPTAWQTMATGIGFIATQLGSPR
ncbi:LpqB family beta-propeller domain-containing protein [Okibacterium endophyticum]